MGNNHNLGIPKLTGEAESVVFEVVEIVAIVGLVISAVAAMLACWKVIQAGHDPTDDEIKTPAIAHRQIEANVVGADATLVLEGFGPDRVADQLTAALPDRDNDHVTG